MQPSLHGKIISLIPLSMDHLSDLSRYGCEPSLWQWWLRNPPIDPATMKIEIDLALQQQEKGERIPFTIFHKIRKECIGSTSLWSLNQQNRSVEIGSTWLALPFHRSGVNRECKALLFGYLFDELGLNRVVLQTDELNIRSRKAIEGLGAKLDGILREDKVVWDGRVRSSVIYSILKNEWKKTVSPVPST